MANTRGKREMAGYGRGSLQGTASKEAKWIYRHQTRHEGQGINQSKFMLGDFKKKKNICFSILFHRPVLHQYFLKEVTPSFNVGGWGRLKAVERKCRERAAAIVQVFKGRVGRAFQLKTNLKQ